MDPSSILASIINSSSSNNNNNSVQDLVEILTTLYDSYRYEYLHSPISTLPLPIQTIVILSTFHFLKTFIINPLRSNLPLFLEFTFTSAPSIDVPQSDAEAKDDGVPNSTKPTPIDQVKIYNPKTPNQIQCFDPATLQLIGTVPALTKDEVNTLCLQAKNAQKAWSQTTYKQRRLVLRTIQKYILSHQEDICRVCSRDSGKPKVDALLGEIMTTCEKIRCINVNGEEWLQPSLRPVGPMMMHKTAYVEYVPYGVLGVIAPWNYPFHNMLNHVISGLFSGNAVVSKVSEHTAWSSIYFTNIVRKALEVCGHDVNVVQTLTGFGDCGAALVECEYVDKIIFTGSPKVGRMVMKGCSSNLKPCILELGGKDPMVFCDDVDIEVWIMDQKNTSISLIVLCFCVLYSYLRLHFLIFLYFFTSSLFYSLIN